MTYYDNTTLKGTTVPNMTPAIGEPANAAWLKNGESAEETILNRPVNALSLNCDHLKGTLGWDAVCGPTGDTDCDYAGDDSLATAIAAVGSESRIFVKPGLYTPTGAVDLNQANVTIVGVLDTLGVAGTRFDMTAGDFTVSADGVNLRSLFIDHTSTTDFIWSGSSGSAEYLIVVDAVAITLSGNAFTTQTSVFSGPTTQTGSSIVHDYVSFGSTLAITSCTTSHIHSGFIVGALTINGASSNVSILGGSLASTATIDGSSSISIEETGIGDDLTITNASTRVSVKNTVVVGLLDCNGVTHCSFSNMTVGGVAQGIVVRGSSSQCSFENILVTAGMAGGLSPVISVYPAFYCNFSNVKVVNAGAAVDQVALYLRSVSNISFVGCEFSAQDAFALELERNNSFSLFENCKFYANQQIIETYEPGFPTTNSIYAKFSNCLASSTGSGSHTSTTVSLVSRNGGGGPLYQQGIQVDNCVFTDDNCAFHDGAGGGAPLVHFVGVKGSDITVSCLTASMNSVGNIANFESCEINRIQFLTNTGGPAGTVATGSTGAVHITDSILDDVIISIAGSWDIPAFHVASTVPIAGWPVHDSILQNARFISNLAYYTSASTGLLARIGFNGTVKGLRWDVNNQTDAVATTDTLVYMNSDDAALLDSDIDHRTGIATYLLRVANASNTKILRNRLRADNGRGAVAMSNIIRVDSPAAGTETAGQIRNNHIIWDDDATGSGAGDAIIFVDANNVFWEVTGNYIYVYDISGLAVVIYFGGTIYPTGAGGTGGDGAVVTSNRIYNDDAVSAANTLPTIADSLGNAIIGAADNVLCAS